MISSCRLALKKKYVFQSQKISKMKQIKQKVSMLLIFLIVLILPVCNIPLTKQECD